MKTRHLISLLHLTMLLAGASTALAQGTAFTYQGRLTDGTNALRGFYDLRFTLHGTLAGVGTVANTPTNTVTVPTTSNGLFTATLDFGGGAFDGNPRWLETGVRSNGTAAAFTVLSPRQPVTPTPYAIRAANAGLLNGQGPTAFAPATGSAQYVAKAGDTMTGTLNLPANGLVAGGSQLVLSGGKVGIGTPAPASALHVDGVDVRFVRNNHPLVFNADAAGTGTRAELTSDLALALAPGNSEKMRITADGNVGIGISGPATKLHLFGGSGAVTEYIGSGDDAMGRMKLSYDASAKSSLITSWATDGYKPLQLEGGPITLNASSGGNVGIGTSSPASPLHIHQAGSDGLRFSRNTFAGYFRERFRETLNKACLIDF